MYRILIVDDEPMIVEGLSTLLEERNPWELEVQKACLATQALEILNRQRIDILLTDIRMPVIDGLELMRRVRVNWPDCRILFLTAFEEFEYAYAALKNPGVRFLLKTEGHDAILKAVGECVQEMEEELKEKALRMRSQEQLGIIRALRLRELWSGVIAGDAAPISQKIFDALEIPFQAEQPVTLLLGAPVSPIEDPLLQMNLLTDLLTIRLRDKARCFAYQESGGFVWFLQPCASLPPSITQALPKLIFDELDAAKTVCQSSFCFVLAEQPAAWDQVFYEYQHLKSVLRLQLSTGKNLIYVAPGEKDTPTQESSLFRAKEACKKEMQLLKADLETGNREAFSKRLSALYEALLELSSQRREIGRELALELNLLFLSCLNQISHAKATAQTRALSQELSQAELSGPFPQDRYLAFGEALFDFQQASSNAQTHSCVETVKSYIRNHLDGDLSLSRLSELSNYNPKYLSDLFRAQTGRNLSAYISEKRLEEAKRLIAEGKLKMKDISAAVGFFSSSYFTRFFKKVSGMTPLQYQESLRSDREDN